MRRRGRMFADKKGKRDRTCNPQTGCRFDCSYCWARKYVEKRLQHSMKYIECLFDPAFHPDVLDKCFGKDNTWFIGSMGDMWGNWVTDEKLVRILTWCGKAHESTTLRFCTKNPLRYIDFFTKYPHLLKDNYIFGATIETNREDIVRRWSKAPPITDRVSAMKKFVGRKFLAFEPLMDCDIEKMIEIVKQVKPEYVYIGMDTGGNNLPEPTPDKIRELIGAIKELTGVRLKATDGQEPHTDKGEAWRRDNMVLVRKDGMRIWIHTRCGLAIKAKTDEQLSERILSHLKRCAEITKCYGCKKTVKRGRWVAPYTLMCDGCIRKQRRKKTG